MQSNDGIKDDNRLSTRCTGIPEKQKEKWVIIQMHFYFVNKVIIQCNKKQRTNNS